MSERYKHLGVAPHPIEFTKDEKGWHFASDCQPLRTIISPDAMSGVMWEASENGTVKITLDGKTVVYDRTGYDLAGNWICDLRIGSKRGIEG